MYVLWVLCVNR